jgi:hypothetical protein
VQSLNRIIDLTSDWIGAVILAVLAVWWWWTPPVGVPPHTMWAVLATLPGILGLVTHFSSVLPRFRSRSETVRDYQAFCKGFDEWWLTTGWPQKLEEIGYPELAAKKDFAAKVKGGTPYDDDLHSFRPSTIGAIWAALILTVVFEIAVNVATQGQGYWKAAHWPIFDVVGYQGFIFAAAGAFVSVMWRMINRINANALTERFMFTAALRSAIAMVIGMIVAHVDLFGLKDTQGKGATFQAAVFFLTGLFTDWALTSLRTRARTVFNQTNDPCDRLPLCFVDGLDDGVIDILDELGIWDVQHLATCEPGELTIRTLYPFNRIIDWIDQAILISYLRRNVADARLFGITGAIDLSTLFSYTLDPKPGMRDKANTILDDLSKKMGMSRAAIDLICSNLFFDYSVEQLYRFWQHMRRDENGAKTA